MTPLQTINDPLGVKQEPTINDPLATGDTNRLLFPQGQEQSVYLQDKDKVLMYPSEADEHDIKFNLDTKEYGKDVYESFSDAIYNATTKPETVFGKLKDSIGVKLANHPEKDALSARSILGLAEIGKVMDSDLPDEDKKFEVSQIFGDIANYNASKGVYPLKDVRDIPAGDKLTLLRDMTMLAMLPESISAYGLKRTAFGLLKYMAGSAVLQGAILPAVKYTSTPDNGKYQYKPLSIEEFVDAKTPMGKFIASTAEIGITAALMNVPGMVRNAKITAVLNEKAAEVAWKLGLKDPGSIWRKGELFELVKNKMAADPRVGDYIMKLADDLPFYKALGQRGSIKLPGAKGDKGITPTEGKAEIIKGKEVASIINDIGSAQGGLLRDTVTKIKKNNFSLQEINISDLTAKNPDIIEYAKDWKPRDYNQDEGLMSNEGKYEVEAQDLYDEPIVVIDGEVVDGWSRVADHIKRGDLNIQAYTSMPKGGEVAYKTTEGKVKDLEKTIRAFPTDQLESFISSRYEAGATQEELDFLETIWDERVSEDVLAMTEAEVDMSEDYIQGTNIEEALIDTYQRYILSQKTGEYRGATTDQIRNGFLGVLEEISPKKPLESVTNDQVFEAARDLYENKQALLTRQKSPKTVEEKLSLPVKKQKFPLKDENGNDVLKMSYLPETGEVFISKGSASHAMSVPIGRSSDTFDKMIRIILDPNNKVISTRFFGNRGDVYNTEEEWDNAKLISYELEYEAAKLFAEEHPDWKGWIPSISNKELSTGEILDASVLKDKIQPFPGAEGTPEEKISDVVTGTKRKRIVGAPPVRVRLETLVKLAKLGKSGKGWYKHEAELIAEMFGVNDYDKALKIMAELSTGTQPALEVEYTLKALYQSSLGQKISTGRRPNKVRDNIEKILDGEEPSWNNPEGLKKRFYYETHKMFADKYFGRKFSAPVMTVQDMWMARALGYQRDTFTRPQYKYADALTKKVADALGVDYWDAQAMIWTGIQSKRGMTSQLRQEALNRLSVGLLYEYISPDDEYLGFNDKVELTTLMDTVLTNKTTGKNIIAEMVGIRGFKSFAELTNWDGALRPSIRATVFGTNYNFDGNVEIEMVNQFADSLGYVLRQDSIATFKPARGGHTAVIVDIGRPMTMKEKQFYADELKAIGIKAFGPYEKGIRYIDYFNEYLTTKDLNAKLEPVNKKFETVFKVKVSVSGYRDNGSIREGGEEGNGYIQRLNTRRDLQDALRSVRSNLDGLKEEFHKGVKERQKGIPRSKQTAAVNKSKLRKFIDAIKAINAKIGKKGSAQFVRKGEDPFKDLRKERGFVTSVKETLPEFSPSGIYIPRSTDRLGMRAANMIKDDLKMAEKAVLEETGDKQVALAAELLKYYSKQIAVATDPTVIEMWKDKGSEMANEVARALTEHGRASQAAVLLSRLTVEGQLRFAARTIQKYNEEVEKNNKFPWRRFKNGAKEKIPELTPDQMAEITRQFGIIDGMPEGETKAMAFQALQNYVADLVPTPLMSKILAVWKAGLLTGFKTSGTNIFANLTHAGTEMLADVPGAGWDMMMSLFTGERALSPTFKGYIPGFKEGAGKGWKFLKTGYDERNALGKLEYSRVKIGDSPAAKLIQAYEEIIFRILSAEDQAFYYGAKLHSLYGQAKVAAINQGLKGKEADAFIENLVYNPTDEMIGFAIADAEVAVFQNQTALSNFASAIKKHMRVAEFILPFSKTPSAVAMQIINYSPVGFFKTWYAYGRKENFNQREFSKGMGRATTGLGFLGFGAWLMGMGLMCLDRPKSESEQEQWKKEGKIPNSIYYAGAWRSVQTLGPGGNLLLVGGHYMKAVKDTGSPMKAFAIASFGGIKSFNEQTFLKGTNTALSAVNDPGRYAETFTQSLFGSIVPTIVKDVGVATDKTERRVENPLEAIMARVPFLRKLLQPQVDFQGQEIERSFNAVEAMIDPSRPSHPNYDPILGEIRRLTDAGENIPTTKLGPKEGYPSLTQEQNTNLWKMAGSVAYENISNLMNTPGYERIKDEVKASQINKYVREAGVKARAAIIIEATKDLSSEERRTKLKKFTKEKLMTQEVFDMYKATR